MSRLIKWVDCYLVDLEISRNLKALFIYEFLLRMTSSILMNFNQWGSYLPCKTYTKEPMELEVISNLHHQRPHGQSNSGPLDPKINALTTQPQIHMIYIIPMWDKVETSTFFISYDFYFLDTIFDIDLIKIKHTHKRGSRGAARAAKSLRWSV